MKRERNRRSLFMIGSGEKKVSGSFVAVEVENSYLVELLKLGKQREGRLHLTTVEPDQRVAFVKVFFYKEDKKELLHTIKIDRPFRFTKQPGGKPKIDLEGKMISGRHLELRLFLEDSLYTTVTVDVGKYLSSSAWKWAVPAAAALLIAGLLLFLLLPDRESRFGRERVSSETGTVGKSRLKEPEPTDRLQPQTGLSKAGPAERSGPGTTERDAEHEGARNVLEKDGGQEGARNITERKTETEPEQAAEQTEETVRVYEWTVYFEPDRAYLTQEAAAQLKEIAEILKRNPESEARISGHCALYGTESGRIQLSKERAQKVLAYLDELNWEPDESTQIEWHGAEQYITTDRNKQHLNRRVEIEVIR